MMHRLFDLTNKTAIVTGGGTGLGKQIAIGLAEAGASVVICSRKLEKCEEACEEIQQLGVQSMALACDVTQADDIKRVLQQTKERFGALDILVNNSGTSWMAPFFDVPEDKWKRVMEVNVKGMFLFSQAAGKMMAEQQSGKIINIASIAGMYGQQATLMDAWPYSTSKGAVIALTKDLAAKLAPFHVQVNAIAPGFFPTKLTSALQHVRDDLLAKTPSGRLGNAEDLKGAAIYLASKASDYVTGHILVVDGGMSATI
ncbi:SDR family oxidoreductase [Anoxybacillus sp. PDR2]